MQYQRAAVLTQQRKLAAIMFTDIVGFTALMGKDEAKALQLLHKNWDLLKPLIKEHRGDWLKEIGDGTLSSFASAVEAVQCALDIQKILKDDPELTLRIGIHIGDVVFEEGDVFGDGVNVASRIEPLAAPGGICVSERVYEDIRNKPEIETVYLGERSLKNVDHPVKVYALTGEGLATPPARAPAAGDVVPQRQTKRRAYGIAGMLVLALFAIAFGFWSRFGGNGGATGPIRSIAVLPLTNLMGDAEQDYFVDGMHEALITALSRLEGLRVISRTSVRLYRDHPKSIAEIAAELDVDAIVEGSVLRAGERVRITAQLLGTRPERHLWAQEYDRNLEDILSLHSDVALAIARQIELAIDPDDAYGPAASPAKVNSEAYNYVLLGKSYADRDHTRQNFEIALDMYTQAAALDSTYAQAYAGQARMHESMYWFHYDHSPERILLAREALSKAERLGPDDPNVLFVKGMYLYHCYLDYEGALREFDKIRAVWPNNPDVDYGYGSVLRRQGKMVEAAKHWRRSVSLDPLNAVVIIELGATYALQRSYPEALASLNKALALAPDRMFSNLTAIHMLYRWDGSTARAREMLAAAQAQTGLKGDPNLMHSGVLLKMFDGHFDQALALLRSIPDEVISSQLFIVPKSLLAGQITRLMGATASAMPHFDSARMWLEGNLAASYDDARFHSALGLAWAGLGEREKALEAGRRGVAELPISKEAWRGYHRLIDLAMIQTMTGNYEDALESVDRLLALPGDLSLNELLLDPRWAALTQQPGFSRIEKKYGGDR